MAKHHNLSSLIIIFYCLFPSKKYLLVFANTKVKQGTDGENLSRATRSCLLSPASCRLTLHLIVPISAGGKVIKHREECGGKGSDPCGPSMSSWREEGLLQKAFCGCSFVPSCPQRTCFPPLMWLGFTWKLELAGEFWWQETCSIFWAPGSSCNCAHCGSCSVTGSTSPQILLVHLKNAEVEKNKSAIKALARPGLSSTALPAAHVVRAAPIQGNPATVRTKPRWLRPPS